MVKHRLFVKDYLHHVISLWGLWAVVTLMRLPTWRQNNDGKRLKQIFSVRCFHSISDVFTFVHVKMYFLPDFRRSCNLNFQTLNSFRLKPNYIKMKFH